MASFEDQAKSAAEFASSLSGVEAAALGAAGATVKLKTALGAVGVAFLKSEFESYNKALHNTRLALGGSAESALKFASSVKQMTDANVSSRKSLVEIYTALKSNHSIMTQMNVSMAEMTSRLQKDFPESTRQAAAQISRMSEQTSYFNELTSSGTSSTVAFSIALKQFGIEGARALQSIRGDTINLSKDQNAMLIAMNEAEAAAADLKQGLTKAFQTPILGVLGMTKAVRGLFDAMLIDDQGKLNQWGKAFAPVMQGFIAFKSAKILGGLSSLTTSATSRVGSGLGGVVSASGIPVRVMNAVTVIGMSGGAVANVGGGNQKLNENLALRSMAPATGMFAKVGNVGGRAWRGVKRGYNRMGGGMGLMGGAFAASQIYGGYEEARLTSEGDVGVGSTVGGSFTGGMAAGMMGLGVPGVIVGGIVGGLGSIITRGLGRLERVNQRANELLSALAQRGTGFALGTTGGTVEFRRRRRLAELRGDISGGAFNAAAAAEQASFAASNISRLQKKKADLPWYKFGKSIDISKTIERYERSLERSVSDQQVEDARRLNAMREHNKILEEEIRISSNRVEFSKANVQYLEFTFKNEKGISDITSALRRITDNRSRQLSDIVSRVGVGLMAESGIQKFPGGDQGAFDFARDVTRLGSEGAITSLTDKLRGMPEDQLRSAFGQRTRAVATDIRTKQARVVSIGAEISDADSEKRKKLLVERKTLQSDLIKLGDEEVRLSKVDKGSKEDIAKSLANSMEFLARQPDVQNQIIESERLRIQLIQDQINAITKGGDLKRELLSLDMKSLSLQESIAQSLKKSPMEIATIRKANLNILIEDRKIALDNHNKLMKEIDDANAKKAAGLKMNEKETSLAETGDKKRKESLLKVQEVDAAIAKQVDYIRRGWEEMFTQQSLNLSSGSYLLPTMTGMMEKGSAFMAFTPARETRGGQLMGHGTYGGLTGAAYGGAFQHSQEQFGKALNGITNQTYDLGNAFVRFTQILDDYATHAPDQTKQDDS